MLAGLVAINVCWGWDSHGERLLVDGLDLDVPPGRLLGPVLLGSGLVFVRGEEVLSGGGRPRPGRPAGWALGVS